MSQGYPMMTTTTDRFSVPVLFLFFKKIRGEKRALYWSVSVIRMPINSTYKFTNIFGRRSFSFFFGGFRCRPMFISVACCRPSAWRNRPETAGVTIFLCHRNIRQALIATICFCRFGGLSLEQDLLSLFGMYQVYTARCCYDQPRGVLFPADTILPKTRPAPVESFFTVPSMYCSACCCYDEPRGVLLPAGILFPIPRCLFVCLFVFFRRRGDEEARRTLLT
ncbi:unnamed protein product [Laminaria digitata]